MDTTNYISISDYLLPLACSISCALILLIIILVPSFIIVAKSISKLNLQKQLKNDFINKYGFLPSKFTLNRFQVENKSIQQNHFELGFPRWSIPNQDGTKNRRYSGNTLILQRSSIWLLDDFVLTCNNPLLMLKYVSFLREQRGVYIQQNYYEAELAKKVSDFKILQQNDNDKNKLFLRYIRNPYKFEQYCADLLAKEGYNAKVTSQTNDGGFDIVLQTKDGRKGLVECKCYQPDSSIGRPLLQKLVGANAVEKAELLFFITTGRFSENALTFAKQTNVICIDGDSLLKLHQKYYPPGNTSFTASYTEWKLTGEYLYPLFPPDVYQSMLEEPLKFIRVK